MLRIALPAATQTQDSSVLPSRIISLTVHILNQNVVYQGSGRIGRPFRHILSIYSHLERLFTKAFAANTKLMALFVSNEIVLEIIQFRLGNNCCIMMT